MKISDRDLKIMQDILDYKPNIELAKEHKISVGRITQIYWCIMRKLYRHLDDYKLGSKYSNIEEWKSNITHVQLQRILNHAIKIYNLPNYKHVKYAKNHITKKKVITVDENKPVMVIFISNRCQLYQYDKEKFDFLKKHNFCIIYAPNFNAIKSLVNLTVGDILYSKLSHAPFINESCERIKAIESYSDRTF